MKTSTKQLSTKHLWLRYGLVGLIFCILSVVTISAFKITHTFEKRRIESEAERLISSKMASLQRSLDLTLESIQAMGAYIGASAYVRQESFKQYAKEMRQSRQGVATVAWIPQILKADQRMFMMTIHRQQGFADFAMTELSSDGKKVPVSQQRERYFPLTYGEPFEDLASMSGLDMGSQTDWLKAIEQGRDKGVPVATKAFPYDKGKQFQIGIFQPVYYSGLPNKLAARRANLRGFIFVTVELHDIINQAVGNLMIKNFTLQLTQTDVKDLTVSNKPLAFESPVETHFFIYLMRNIQYWLSLPLHELPQSVSTTLTVAEQSWSVDLTPNTELTIAQSAWGVLAGGSLLTLLFVAYLLMLIGRTARIERMVAERTLELEESEAYLVQSEKMASIGQMVAGIVHEINTPLAYVRSSVELTKGHISEITETLAAYEKLGTQLKSDGHTEISEEQLDTAMAMLHSLQEDETLEEAQLLLDNGISGLDKISNLVKNLKDFSRLDRATSAEHDVNKGLDDALTMVNHMLNNKIQMVKHYGEVPHIMCSPAQLNQVFLNLLVNAIHATESAKDGVIELTTQLVGQHVNVSIKDNGNGISEENLARIFEPFFTTKRSGKGTGLGLAIAYKIIKEHQGELMVESQVGRGSQFTISLPIKQ
ncbi:MAG: CHASE domain-containing protein [Thiomargarita sp.]|nr:CHASE domain-containing protein [Thiomargarita sp.]